MQLQVAHHLLGIAGRSFAILSRQGVPGAGGPFKGIEPCNAIALFLHAPRLAGIDTFGALLGFGTRLPARSRKRVTTG
ncbi:hypothetical protein [Variovorax paradoxus]|uniref:hypothetical protein n=1 Tax=Variovorax paradoxus TaxID=34073 RepID=UPI0027D80233|nr:hypothetical protein [Variovorax paradoxus]